MGRTLVVAALVGAQLALAGAARADAPSSIANAPDNSSGGPISVTYSATVGTTSVELWAKGPADSGYVRAETDTTPDSPSFMRWNNSGPVAADLENLYNLGDHPKAAIDDQVKTGHRRRLKT